MLYKCELLEACYRPQKDPQKVMTCLFDGPVGMHKNLWRHQPPGRATGNGAARKAFATCNLAINLDRNLRTQKIDKNDTLIFFSFGFL